jgi:hypothetical protein
MAMALMGAAAAAAADVEVRTIAKTFDLEAGQQVVLEVPLGELFVRPGEAGKVEIDVVVSCDSDSRRCRERAEEIYVQDIRRRRSLDLEIEGYSNKLTSRPSVEVRLHVPGGSGLEIEMGVGTLEIEDLTGEVEVDLGVGEVVVFARQSTIGSLDLTVGVGSAEISPRPRGQSSSGFLFLGNEIFWDEGEGTAHYAIEVGVGEIEIRLEDP